MDYAAEISKQYARLLAETKKIYLEAADLWSRSCPDRWNESPDALRERMQLLHEGVAIKTYVMVSRADQRWSHFEKILASVLCQHLWGKVLEGRELRSAAGRLFADADRLEWSTLFRPFREWPPLRDYVSRLETVVIRMGHLIAKADGEIRPTELQALRTLEQALDELILPANPTPDTPPPTPKPSPARTPTKSQKEEAKDTQTARPTQTRASSHSQDEAVSEKPSLEETLAELDSLVGLEQVKSEVRTLVNVIELRRRRQELGLPAADLSLHMVFRGNPGTGKTTVARLVARIFAAMGILAKGHLIETDRSGLVAEYAGQTGPKTHEVIDQALDGVLFIDEAYALVASEGDDPYGAEALQALLKRMEDQRERLVVILAGYPRPLDELLRSNPGLRSRFTQHFTFEDFCPADLGRVFERLAERLHYTFGTEARIRLLQGFTWAYEHRDEHFGNGRYARNVLERAIRRLANRTAGQTPLTRELLTTFQPEDLVFPGVPDRYFRPSDQIRVKVQCSHCRQTGEIPGTLLDRELTCRQCQKRFRSKWGEVKGEV